MATIYIWDGLISLFDEICGYMHIVPFSLPLHQDANAWSLLGHTHFLMGDFPSAKDCYERTVDYVTRPAHLHTVYLRLADIYLREQQVAMCGEHNWMLGVLILNFLPSLPSLVPSHPHSMRKLRPRSSMPVERLPPV